MPPLMPPPASHMREALDVVVAARRLALALEHRRAAELAAPDDQRVVEHAALLQVGDQAPQVGRSVSSQQMFMYWTRSPWWSQSR